jgi:cytochrome c biogenesis protein CcmG/thiol:disulfide interchange protein DsbE
VYGVPETFVIDRAGVIRFKHIGPITAAVLEQKIVPLLQELARS